MSLPSTSAKIDTPHEAADASRTIDDSSISQAAMETDKHDSSDSAFVSQAMYSAMNIEVTDSKGWTDLHWAIFNKDIMTVKTLLVAGASPNLIDNAGLTPLLLAVKTGRIDLVKQLIDAQADVNYIDIESISAADGRIGNPLHDAIRDCNVDILKLLLNNGAKPNYVDAWCECSLLSAAASAPRNKAPMLKALLDHGANVKKDEVFLRLFDNNDVEGVRGFLDHGSDFRFIEPRNLETLMTPLHEAVQMQNICTDDTNCKTAMLSLFLNYYDRRGILSRELDRGDKRNGTALHYAASGHPEYVRLLLEAGANPNRSDANSITPLAIALFNDNCLCYKNIQLLVESGAGLRNFIERLVDQAFQESQKIWKNEEYFVSFFDRTWDPRNEDKFERHRRSMKQALCIVKYRVLYENRVCVKDSVYASTQDSVKLRDYYNACKSEIAFLQTRQFDNAVTYCDMLTDEHFWKFVSSTDAFEGFRHIIVNLTISNSIPIYLDDLKSRWERGYDNYKLWKLTWTV